MKKLTVKKNSECMACLQCVQACSEAFYKEFDPDLSCIQIVAKGTGAKPNVCIQCGKCMKACEHGAITQNPKTGMYMSNKKLCVSCGKCVEVWRSSKSKLSQKQNDHRLHGGRFFRLPLWGGLFYSSTILVATLSQKVLSCSTKRMVGLNSSSSSSICIREITSI